MEIPNKINTVNSPKKMSNGVKALLVILSFLVVVLLFFIFSLYSEKKKTTEQLTQQKEQLISELKVMQSDYDKAVEKQEGTNRDLVEARNTITQYIDSLKSAKADISVLWKYKNQVQVLKKERERLLAITDSLTKYNQVITQERDSTIQALVAKAEYADSLVQQNSKLAKVVEQGSALQLKSLSIEAVKERSGGKLVNTQRARTTDKIRVCFTVAPNRIADTGNKHFYVQVLSPLGVSLGKNALLTKDEKTINYSVVSEFIYENEDLDVCEFITESSGKKFDRGLYTVNIYNEQLQLIGEAEFSLK